ncbi:MFS transporter [Dactylosporangium matsuzakiense]|uniref:MFS transporter n=1 Tax=Dactylosporangium matsuzakiense TaxID=53360 RepID=A0A9W6KLS6_9ACTN|nr:MFS transporter [Dactylosporangium matsuzakiense]UWZ43293.1 MFS transporter [Dactylosporangium matsuzakiense]GLL02601.1 MFS transporter [Dactylosporangium matsuzakiense]
MRRSPWVGLAVLALPTLLLSLDVSVLYLALPKVSADLHADATEQLWILDIYSFMLAGFLVTMGALGDRIGRRRLLLIGAVAFGVASVAAAYATSPAMLIAARAALGVAGATLMPSTMALIRNMFPDPKQMGAAIGAWFACFMGGMTLGPLVGGLLLEHFWWGSAFLLGAPFMVLLLIAGPALLPEYRPDRPEHPIDLLSVGLSLAAILPVIWGLKALARDGVHPAALAAVAAGLVLGALFVRRQRSLPEPLLDLRLFASRVFSTALGIMLLGGVVMAGLSLVASLYLQNVAGLSPLAAGVLLIPQNIAMILGSLAAPALARRLPAATVTAIGLTASGVGLAVVALVGPHSTALLVVGLVLASVGISFPMALTMNLMMAAAPPEKAGSAASISETSGEFGIAVGIATLGSLASLVYRSTFDLPADAPASARNSLIEALATGRPDITAAARAAFTTGLNAVGIVGAAIFLGLAVTAALTLRTRSTPTTPAAATRPDSTATNAPEPAATTTPDPARQTATT